MAQDYLEPVLKGRPQLLLCACGVFLWVIVGPAPKGWAQGAGEFGAGDVQGPISVDVDLLPRTVGESETLLDFFKQRTRLGVGFDEAFNDNVFSRDNDKQEDYISYLEGQVVYVDPRGAILYGLSHEINAFRYHIKRVNAIDHDFRAFFDYDPGGRLLYRTDYQMTATNTLNLSSGKIDLLRRSADFQRILDHTVTTKCSYKLDETNSLVSQFNYESFDDQVVNDSETDRRKWKAFIDWTHDLRPGWIVFGGFSYSKTYVIGNNLKSSKARGLRFGVRHEWTEVSTLNTTFEFERSEFKDGKKADDFNFIGGWEYKVSPRTTLTLGYINESRTSFAAGRLRFRRTNSSLAVSYELTPLTTCSFSANYEKQRSTGQDVLAGTAATAEVQRKYNLSVGLKWQVREKAHVTLDYNFSRSKSRDTTTQLTTLGFETEF